jgi:alanyl-tRNA synthetase
VEAYTADTAEQFINDKMHLLEEVQEVLKNPKDVLKAVQTLLDEKSKMQKQIEQFQLQQVQMTKNSILQERKEVNGINVIVAKASFPSADSLKKLSFEMKNEVEKLFMVLAADIEGKPQISVVIDDQLVKEKDLHAGNLVKDLAKNIQGGGGGQPFFATAGGKDINGLQAVVEAANDIVKEKL